MANAPVCTLRDTGVDPRQQYNLWGMPSGTAYATGYSNPGLADPRQVYYSHLCVCLGHRLLRNVSCIPNVELGVSHAWLPVTHTRVGASVGLWFYYVRCYRDPRV